MISAEYPECIAIHRDYDASLPALKGDREQLIQAVLNIVRNAAQLLQGKGEITLRTRIVRQVTLARKRYRHAISVQVIDNGPGLDAAHLDNIFLPFFTTKRSGSGVGLSVSRQIMALNKGMLTVKTAPGAGSEFTLRFR